MADKSKLRKEIEALRNQAIANGKIVDKPSIKINREITHKYIKQDLLKTLVFVLIILGFLFVISIKLSNINIFENIRSQYNIQNISL